MPKHGYKICSEALDNVRVEIAVKKARYKTLRDFILNDVQKREAMAGYLLMEIRTLLVEIKVLEQILKDGIVYEEAN